MYLIQEQQTLDTIYSWHKTGHLHTITHCGQISKGLALSSHPLDTCFEPSLPATIPFLLGSAQLAFLLTTMGKTPQAWPSPTSPDPAVPSSSVPVGPHTALQEALNPSPRFLKACPGVKLQRFLFLCHFPSLLPLPLVPPTLSGHTVSWEVGVHEDHCSNHAISANCSPHPQLKTISKSHFLSSPPWNDFC